MFHKYIYRKRAINNRGFFDCLFVLMDAQVKQIEIATPGKRASHRLGYSSHPEQFALYPAL